MLNKPLLISIVMATYNRAHTIRRAVDSVMRQTYTNFELIIVDDGSNDDTLFLLSQYKDGRIKVLKHATNKGVTAAKNTGLDAVGGDWFTLLDSDDEITPDALEALISIPENIDNSITAITCNCRDSITGEFSGHGLECDGYLPEDKLMNVCSGEFWGITHTDLLRNDRFNEQLPGCENTLWYKINSRSNRYYLHQALRIYHTEGDDRITKKQTAQEKRTLKPQAAIFAGFLGEPDYLATMARYKPYEFQKLCIKGMLVSSATGESANFDTYRRLYRDNVRGFSPLLVLFYASILSGKLLNTFLFNVISSKR